MATKTIAVVGVTGNQGGSVAAVFSKLPGWHVRGIARNPEKPAALALKDQGIDVVTGNLDDVASLKAAFAGATAVFAVTDFWQHIKDPAAHALAASRGITVNEVAYEREVQQGHNIVDAAADTSGIERLVLSTANSSKKNSKGKITFNLHFDAKWAAVEYLQTTYPALWEKTSLLQMGAFNSNWKQGSVAPRKGPDGKFTIQIPMRGNRPYPMVDQNKDTGHYVKALLELPPKTNLLGCGSLITWDQYCAIWSRVNHAELVFEQIDGSVWEQAMGSVGKEVAEMFAYIDEFGYDGGDPDVVYPWQVKERFGVDVEYTTVEEYIQNEDWSSVL